VNKTLIALVAVLATLSMESSAGNALPRFKAGLSLPFLGETFYEIYTTLTNKAASAAGLQWLQATDARFDSGKQISDIQTLVNSGARGLIVVPRDSDAIAPALDYAASKGVAVVVVDQGVRSSKAAITVRADNVGMAQSACDLTAAALHGKGKVLELQGDLFSSNGRERTAGFETCMKAKYPNIQIIARPTRWEPARTADATQTILAVQPDVGAIYMEAASIMLPGVLSVLRQLGRNQKANDPKRIFLVGIDGSPYELSKIRTGELDATVSQPVDLYATLGVEYLRRAVGGEAFAVGATPHGSRIVRSPAGNLEDLLPAPVVTAQNVNDPRLWGNQKVPPR